MNESVSLSAPQPEESTLGRKIKRVVGAATVCISILLMPVNAGAESVAPEPVTTVLAPPLPQNSTMKYVLKALQPDGSQDTPSLAAAETGDIMINIFWPDFEQADTTNKPCDGDAFEGHCFDRNEGVLNTIKVARQIGAHTTGIIIGAPKYALQSPTCMKNQLTCVPRADKNYSAFVGYIAANYDIDNYIVGNESNSSWNDTGCATAKTCNIPDWVTNVFQVYSTAYKRINPVNKNAKIMISLTNDFKPEADNIKGKYPMISDMTFLDNFTPKLQNMSQFALAMHLYNQRMDSPDFGGFPDATFANIQEVVGILRQRYGTVDMNHDIELTEEGTSSSPPYSNEQLQADAVCNSIGIIANTPGVSKITFRLKDNSGDKQDYGLVNSNGEAKLSWAKWAGVRNGTGACYTANWPYIYLPASTAHVPSVNATQLQIMNSRDAWLHRNPDQPTNNAVYTCEQGSKKTLKSNAICDKGTVLFLGYTQAEMPKSGNALQATRCDTAVGDGAITFEVSRCISINNAQPDGWVSFERPTNP